MSPALVAALRKIFGKDTRLVPREVPQGIPRTRGTSIERAFEAALKKGPLAQKFVQQHEIHPKLHVDFGFPDVRLAVECDGEFWHGRTGGQRRRDDMRDTVLRAHGWCTLRFWGKDLLRYADDCAFETIRVYRALGGDV